MRRPSSSAVLTQARIIVHHSSDAPTLPHDYKLPSQRVPSTHTPFWLLPTTSSRASLDYSTWTTTTLRASLPRIASRTSPRTTRYRPELMDARYFLSGWTLRRYTSRFRRESKEEGETECADDEGDGVTPVGPGAFGWTPEGPPSRRAGRRRPHGVLTIPTRATVGQVRYALGFLSFPRFFRPDPTAPSPGSARPRRREHARGARGGRSHGRIRRFDQRRVVAPADTAGDVPGALGPGVCISGRVKSLSLCFSFELKL